MPPESGRTAPSKNDDTMSPRYRREVRPLPYHVARPEQHVDGSPVRHRLVGSEDSLGRAIQSVVTGT